MVCPATSARLKYLLGQYPIFGCPGFTPLCASDGWSELNRGNDGKIVADPTKFPSGIKHVSDYIHSKGKHCLPSLLLKQIKLRFALHRAVAFVSLL